MFVEGYTDQLSYRAGEQVRFHVSTSADQYALEVTRIGAEREVIWQQDQLPGSSHPVPEDASSNGCGWPVSHSLEVPDNWRSGYYEFALRVEDQGGKFVQRGRRTAESRGFFIVRPAGPTDARILLQLATNTYSAYNNWGGYSFYSYHGRGGLQGHRVSFDRPLAGLFDRWERDFVEWAEAAGYALDYCANSDLEWHPELLDNYQLVLSVGHDEYWSAPMRDHLEAYIAAGGNAAFFSGNSVCWRVRSEGRGPGAGVLEATVQHGSSLRRRRLRGPFDLVEPPPRGPAGKRVDRRRLPLRGLSPKPRPIHGRVRSVYSPSPGSLGFCGNGLAARRHFWGRAHHRRL